jgi:pimeloyl-ACP methyl ester carboxylesterase
VAALTWTSRYAVYPVGMPFFRNKGHRLSYTSFGDGPRTVVLVHGLLFNQKMHRPLAQALAARGNRVVTLDLLGHGASDRPRDMTKYSMSIYGGQIVALLDHLEIDEAVLGGTSLGANATLEASVAAPERVRGMIVEMPVLDNALLACALAFTPLLVSLTFGEPITRALAVAARRVPTSAEALFWADVLLDTLRQDPGPSAAVLQGLFFGRIAPPKALRRSIAAPALVIGHGRDPVHPFSDSDALAEELPDARLLRADSFVELRMSPARLTNEISDFVDECWRPSGRARATGGRRQRVA